MYIFPITSRIQREIVILRLSSDVAMVIGNIVHSLNFNLGLLARERLVLTDSVYRPDRYIFCALRKTHRRHHRCEFSIFEVASLGFVYRSQLDEIDLGVEDDLWVDSVLRLHSPTACSVATPRRPRFKINVSGHIVLVAASG